MESQHSNCLVRFRPLLSVAMKSLFFRAGLTVFIFSFAVVTRADTDNGPRERDSFNAGWRFVKGDPAGMTNQLAYANIKDWVEATGAEFTTNADLAAKTKPEGNPAAATFRMRKAVSTTASGGC